VEPDIAHQQVNIVTKIGADSDCLGVVRSLNNIVVTLANIVVALTENPGDQGSQRAIAFCDENDFPSKRRGIARPPSRLPREPARR
jgi:hypothetical protein